MLRRVRVSAETPANPWTSCRSSTASVWFALTLVQSLADAQDHVEAGGQGNSYLLVDERVGFAEDVPSLAVSEDDVLAAEIEKHRRADLAGERAFLLGIEVLRPERDAAALEDLPDKGQIGEGRTDGDGYAVLNAQLPMPSTIALASCLASEAVVCIFQLPTMNFWRMSGFIGHSRSFDRRNAARAHSSAPSVSIAALYSPRRAARLHVAR